MPRRSSASSNAETIPGELPQELERGKIDDRRLLSALSELLEVEGGCANLYAEALEGTNATLKPRLEEGLRQTLRRFDWVENAIRDLCGNPRMPGPGGLLQKQRFEQMRALHPTLCFENLYLAQVQSRQNWEVLEETIPFLDDPHARDLVARLIEETNEEEDSQLIWVRRTLTFLRLKQLISYD